MHLTEAICVTIMIVGIITFILGIFIQSAEVFVPNRIEPVALKKDSGLVMSLLGIAVMVFGIFALVGYQSGLKDGYYLGQRDALRGKWMYKRELKIAPFKVDETITPIE